MSKRVWPAFICLMAVGVGVAAQQGTPFSSRSDLVTVRASVTSPYGFRLTDLTRDDFEVLDNGRRREIVQFAFASRPVDVAVFLDEPVVFRQFGWPLAARVILQSLQAGDRISINTIGGEIQPLTEDLRSVQQLFERPVAVDSRKSFWPNLRGVVASLRDADRNRAVVMLTDGRSVGEPPPSDLMLLARRTDVSLYLTSSVRRATPSERSRQLAQDYLKNLARVTGGRVITMPESAHVPAVYRAFVDELREQYLLGFQPEAFDGRFHTLTVRVKRQGTTVVARAGYTAAQRK